MLFPQSLQINLSCNTSNVFAVHQYVSEPVTGLKRYWNTQHISCVLECHVYRCIWIVCAETVSYTHLTLPTKA